MVGTSSELVQDKIRNPTHSRLIFLIADQEVSASTLYTETKHKRAIVARQLAELYKDGYLHRDKRGKTVYYSLKFHVLGEKLVETWDKSFLGLSAPDYVRNKSMCSKIARSIIVNFLPAVKSKKLPETYTVSELFLSFIVRYENTNLRPSKFLDKVTQHVKMFFGIGEDEEKKKGPSDT